MVTRSPVPILGEDVVRDVVSRLASTLGRSEAWGEGGLDGETGGGVEEGTAAFAVLTALRSAMWPSGVDVLFLCVFCCEA